MNYVEKIILELNKELPGLEPELVNLYALLVFVNINHSLNLKDIHDAWAIWRNTTNPTHKSLIPFDELNIQTQELDRKYLEAIRKVGS